MNPDDIEFMIDDLGQEVITTALKRVSLHRQLIGKTPLNRHYIGHLTMSIIAYHNHVRPLDFAQMNAEDVNLLERGINGISGSLNPDTMENEHFFVAQFARSTKDFSDLKFVVCSYWYPRDRGERVAIDADASIALSCGVEVTIKTNPHGMSMEAGADTNPCMFVKTNGAVNANHHLIDLFNKLGKRPVGVTEYEEFPNKDQILGDDHTIADLTLVLVEMRDALEEAQDKIEEMEGEEIQRLAHLDTEHTYWETKQGYEIFEGSDEKPADPDAVQMSALEYARDMKEKNFQDYLQNGLL